MHPVLGLGKNARNPHFAAHHRRDNARLEIFRDRDNRTVKVMHPQIVKGLRILDIRADRIADMVGQLLDNLRVLVDEDDLAAKLLKRDRNAGAEFAAAENNVLLLHS